MGKIAPFVVSSRDELIENFSKGEGEYLEAYATMKQISPADILSVVRPSLESLINKSDSVEFYRSLEALLDSRFQVTGDITLL